MSDEYKVNTNIKAKEVRVIGVEGEQLGIMLIEDALRRAESLELDLVEIAANATPPVCKILDFGKFKYELQKKEKELKRHSREATIETKEIWLRPNTDDHDIGIKVKHAQEFLKEGDRVRFVLKFKGREAAHADKGITIINKVSSMLEQDANILQPMNRTGQNLIIVFEAKK